MSAVGATRLPSRLVLLGHPVAHSLSPRFQNAALRAAGLAIRYEALDVTPDALGAALAVLRAEDAAGNVTVPHKRAIALACEHVTPAARRAGAVNTFWFESGRLYGDNTDVGGFVAAVRHLLGGASAGWPSRIAVLGAGGAARAVLTAAEEQGSRRVDIVARDPARAATLAGEFPFARALPGVPDDVELVVNATPVGLAGELVPLDPDLLPRAAAVLDLTYRPGETPWVAACREAGHAAADGTEMLLQQGALAFRRFTSLDPDLAVMRAALAGG